MRTHDDNGFGELRSPAPHPADHDIVSQVPLVASRASDPDAVLDLQRTAGNAAVAQLLADERQEEGQAQPGDHSPVLDVVGRGGGQPLDPVTRTNMESGLGADFSDVRIHTDSVAASSAQAVQAHAYTVGNDVVFQSGRYEPNTSGGQHMLAHELTHVVQQRSGPVEGSPSGGGISLSDPSDRFERAAEESASRFVASEHGAANASVGSGSSAPAVQRSGDHDDDQSVQGMFVQRQGAPGEEEDEALQGSFVQREGEEDRKEEDAAG